MINPARPGLPGDRAGCPCRARRVSGADIMAPAKRGSISGWNNEVAGACARDSLGFRRRWRRQLGPRRHCRRTRGVSRYRAGSGCRGISGFAGGGRPVRAGSGAKMVRCGVHIGAWGGRVASPVGATCRGDFGRPRTSWASWPFPWGRIYSTADGGERHADDQGAEVE